MKKVVHMILTLVLTFLFFTNQTIALNVSDFTPALDKKVAKMKTTEEKVEFLRSFSNQLSSPRFTNHKEAKLFANLKEYSLNMLKVFESELQEEQSKNSSKNKTTSNNTTLNKSSTTTQKISKSNLPHLSDNFSNIDEQKIRDAILLRHNEERNNIGVGLYSYNIDLEGSATTRANNLANSHKTNNFHLRNSGDGYYNYNSILNRFSNLGINFPSNIKGAASFSETVGRNTYKCSKSDCTQDLITAIKRTRTNLIMKEKSSNGSHYRAATMKHFTQMGAGIAIDKSNNRYYLVIHYGVEF